MSRLLKWLEGFENASPQELYVHRLSITGRQAPDPETAWRVCEEAREMLRPTWKLVGVAALSGPHEAIRAARRANPPKKVQ